MLKSEIIEIIEFFNNKKKRTKNRIIYSFPKTSWINDETSAKIWGVLNLKNGNLDKRNKALAIIFVARNFTKEKVMNLLNNGNLSCDNIIGDLFKKMEENVLFEHFLSDYLDRNRKRNGINYVIKGDKNLDNLMATDFIFGINDKNGEPKKIWSQLTVCRKKKRAYKKKNMLDLKKRIKNSKYNETIKNMSIRVKPDILNVITVNGKIKESIESGEKPFQNAYNKWINSGYPEGGPTNFLDQNIKEIFETINYFMPIMTEIFLNKNYKKSIEYKKYENKNYILKSSYNQEKDIFSISLYENSNGFENFIFCMDFTNINYSKNNT